MKHGQQEKSIEQRVREQFESINAEDLQMRPNSSLDDLGYDSLDKVELVMALEEEFDIEIPDEDCDKLNTFTEFVSYIGGRTRQ